MEHATSSSSNARARDTSPGPSRPPPATRALARVAQYPVHYELALEFLGVVLNEANVERVFSFSSNTLHDRRTTLGAAIFEAFVIVGLNFVEEGSLTPDVIEEILAAYYEVQDSTGDHDNDDPTEDKEEDNDDDDDEQAGGASAMPAPGTIRATPGAYGGAAAAAAIVGGGETPNTQ